MLYLRSYYKNIELSLTAWFLKVYIVTYKTIKFKCFHYPFNNFVFWHKAEDSSTSTLFTRSEKWNKYKYKVTPWSYNNGTK